MDALHNAGSGPRSRIRYLWCRLFGHREAPVDVSWAERHDNRSRWQHVTLHGVLTGCPRCRSLPPFDLPIDRSGTVYIDDIKAIFSPQPKGGS